MKIKDIITEQPGDFQAGRDAVKKISSPSRWGLGKDNSYQAGRDAVSKVFSPSQWGLGKDNSYQAGRDAVSKVFSPSQWFKGNNQSTTPIDHINLGDKSSFEVRKNLDNLANGNYYQTDITAAKMFYDQLKAGTFKPSIDIESTIQVLKKIIDRHAVSTDELEKIKKLKLATKNLVN